MSRSAPAKAMDFIATFNDPQAAAQYAEGPRRFVPGYEALHRMTAILLAEGTKPDARVLVLGAGGGRNCGRWLRPSRVGRSSALIPHR